MFYPDFYQKIWMGKTAHDRRQREEHLQPKVGVDQAALPNSGNSCWRSQVGPSSLKEWDTG